MGILVVKLDNKNITDLDKCDSEFVINSKIVPSYEDGSLSYTVVDVPVYKKRYEPEKRDYTDYINYSSKTAYLAYFDGKITGQVILRENWNKFCLVEDIRVDKKHRRQGIGGELMDRAITWAKYRGFPGVMVETQDTNVGACRLYESCGFILGGFDTCLYKDSVVYGDEIALFWYLIFKRDYKNPISPLVEAMPFIPDEMPDDIF